jgi:hypothetical protein
MASCAASIVLPPPHRQKFLDLQFSLESLGLFGSRKLCLLSFKVGGCQIPVSLDRSGISGGTPPNSSGDHSGPSRQFAAESFLGFPVRAVVQLT